MLVGSRPWTLDYFRKISQELNQDLRTTVRSTRSCIHSLIHSFIHPLFCIYLLRIYSVWVLVPRSSFSSTYSIHDQALSVMPAEALSSSTTLNQVWSSAPCFLQQPPSCFLTCVSPPKSFYSSALLSAENPRWLNSGLCLLPQLYFTTPNMYFLFLNNFIVI